MFAGNENQMGQLELNGTMFCLVNTYFPLKMLHKKSDLREMNLSDGLLVSLVLCGKYRGWHMIGVFVRTT